MAYRDVSVVLKEVRVTFRMEEGVDLNDVISGLQILTSNEEESAEVTNSEVGDWEVEDSK